MVIEWILFWALPPNLLGTEAIFSLKMVVGTPLHADTAIENQTRLSCAKVKIEVDLLGEFSKNIIIDMKKRMRRFWKNG